jgi:choice-of-anchor A domain-containing protein
MKAVLLSLSLLYFIVVNAQSPTAPALGFNVFIQKDALLTTNETEGPVAIGGQLRVGGNYQVSTNHNGTYTVGGVGVTLLVGGRVSFQSNGVLQVNRNGYIKVGDSSNLTTWYRDLNNAASPIRVTPLGNYNSSSRIQLQANAVNLGVSATNNPVFQGGLIDFNSAFVALKINSTKMSICNHNAILTTPNGLTLGPNNLPAQVKITLKPGINYLNISGTDLNRVNVFTYTNTPSANQVLVVNVNAPGNFSWNVWNQAGIGGNNCPYIIYNFYNTTTLNIQGNSTVQGTVFAPFADIVKTQNQSNIQGQVIGQSYHHAGGENHYYPFLPRVDGCALTTKARIDVNNDKQCDYNNYFRFTSSSVGTAPMSYFWEFGDGTTSMIANPDKVYTNAGSYQVKLKVTGLGGTDSIVKQVLVDTAPNIGFTINDSIQEFTGNNFVFTTINPNNSYTYDWRYGDGSTPGTTINTTKSYQAVGPYFVCQIVKSTVGCLDTAFAWVIVTSDSVGSGNGGGLESESLGGLVGLREFNKSRNNISRRVDYAASPVFIANANYFGKRSGSLSLTDMIPTSLTPGDVARVTSPTDLVNITNALEVVSVDYTVNNVPKAVVLGIKTKNKPYSHTKYICDRLKGATLLNVDSVSVNGFKFIRYLLKQQDGSMEFGISFVIGKTEGNTGYSLQTNWLLAEMNGEDTLFNFQVWSSTPENTNKLVGDIINLVSASATVQQINQVKIPQVYVTKGYRNGSKLVLHFRNLDKQVNVELAIEERLNEQANLTQRNYLKSVNKGDDETIELVVNDGYEYSANITIDTFVTDVIYMADGNWGLDYDRNYTTITRYVTSNEPTRIYNPGALSVYRHASVTAITDDYVMLFKGLVQGNVPANLTPFTHVDFYASGNGKANLTLVRDSIVRWKSQYYVTVDLTPEGKLYHIPISEFKSDSISYGFNPVDVRMVTFARGYQATSGMETIDVSLGGLSFVPTTTGLADRKVALNNIGVQPNPNSGNFVVDFKSNQTENITIKVVDILGKQIYTSTHHVVKGNNRIPVEVTNLVSSNRMLFVSIESEDNRYTTVKVLVQ